MSLVDRLASFALDMRGEKIPGSVRREAERAVFNFIGCAVGGSANEATRISLRAIGRTAGAGRSTVFGHGVSLDMASAAFINCIAASVDAFDDTDAVMMLHPSSPISAAAFSVAEEAGASGADLIDAVVAGMEVEYRLCRMLAYPPATYRKGTYLTGVTGGAGAAAAVAKLLRLSQEETARAMAIACVAGAGQQDALSSMCCPFIPSNTARNGVMAAILAQEGFTASATAIEGPRGLARVFSDNPNFDAVTDQLGSRFDQMSITYKPYPCGIVVHAALDACLEIAGQPGFKPEAIAKVAARVPPITIELMGGQPAPKDSMQAQVSAHHWIAGALVTGGAGIELAEQPSFHDAAIARVRALVELVPDAALARHATQLTVTMRDGRVFDHMIETARGSIDNPMSDGDLEDKFRAYAGRIVGNDIEELIAAARQVGTLRDLSGLAGMAGLSRRGEAA